VHCKSDGDEERDIN